MRARSSGTLLVLTHAGMTLLVMALTFRHSVAALYGQESTLADHLLEGASRVLGFPLLFLAEHLEVNLLHTGALLAWVGLNSLLWSLLLAWAYTRSTTRWGSASKCAAQA